MRSELQQLEHRIYERFVKAFATYHLLEDGDHVLVGLSGGKDSLCLLEMLAKRSRIDHPQFKVEAAHVRMENIHYESDASYLQSFCSELSVPLHIVNTRFEIGTDEKTSERISSQDLRRQKQPCFLCSWNRRKQLFNLAQQLGCNKIALGHHQDDLLHTALMNLTFQSRFATMPALLRMHKMPITIIRPLCLVAEADIERYAMMRNYEKQQRTCPYEHESNRTGMKHIFEQLEQMNPEVRYSLWNALEKEDKLIEMG